MCRIAPPLVVVNLLLSPAFNAFVAAQTTRPAPAATPAPTPGKSDASGDTQQLPLDAKRALNARVPEVKFDAVRLEDAIDFLQASSGANIHVNWRALETVNITKETPITLRLQPLTLRKLLRFVLAEASPEGLATFYAEDGVVEVTTKEMSDQRLIIKVYPVEDLLITIPDFTDAPQFQLQQSTGAGRGGGGGGGQSLFGQGAQDTGDSGANKVQRGEELKQLVMDTVQPDVWRENGGTASIRFFRGKLIVTAPRSVHEKIGGAVE